MIPQRLFSRVLASSSSSLQACRMVTQQRSFATQTQVQATVIRYKENGKPSDVLKVEKESIPSDLKPNDVLVRMEAAPINPADINVIEGTYANKATLPAIAGLEGVGTVQAVGSGVKDLSVNDRVIPAQAGFGTWRSHAVTSSDKLLKIPKDIPVHYAAVLSVNPATAYRLLSDFGDLKSGDCIIQNAANSTVGQAVIQIAKGRGIYTINIVRDRPPTLNSTQRQSYEDVSSALKSLGADIVVSESYARTHEFKRSISGLPKPRVGFNGVGGPSATEIARNLADGGVLVTYGAMGRQPISLPNSLFIFRDIQCRGFWLTKWVSEHSKEEHAKMMEELAKLVRDNKLKLFLEAHKLSNFEAALKRNAEPFRDRKVVLELTH